MMVSTDFTELLGDVFNDEALPFVEKLKIDVLMSFVVGQEDQEVLAQH